MSEACVFCQIVTERRPDGDFEDHGLIVSFTPLGPVTPGHRLFVPKVHVPDAASGSAIAGRTFEAAASHGRKAGGAFNLITNNGQAATQSIFHLHVHYVPRAVGDGLALPWYSGKKSTKEKP